MVDSGRIGIDLKNDPGPGHLSARDVLTCAQLAEDLGYASVWLNEDIGYDSFALLSAIAARTERLGLGTAIVNAYTRSPMQIAMGAVTVDALAQARLTLGLSVGHHPWNDLAHGIPLEAPLLRIRETVEFVRKALSGQHFTYDGRLIRGVRTQLGITPLRQHIPIFVGAERPRMIDAAAAVADGLLINVVPFDYLAQLAIPRFRQAAERAGRDPDALEIVAIITCCLDDPVLARRAFLGRLRADPRKRLATMPRRFRDEVTRLAQCVDDGQMERAVDMASDELVAQFIISGSRHDIQRYFDAGCTRVALASYPRDAASVQHLMRALAPQPVP